MKSKCTCLHMLSACMLLLAGNIISAFAEPITLPDWVKPMESSLPKISPEVIAEVDDIFWFQILNEEYPVDSVKPKLRANAFRIVDLKEQAGLAMIWQYFKSTVRGGNPEILRRLATDREVAAWLLPILRYRLGLFKQAAEDHNLDAILKSTSIGIPDLSNLEEYFFSQGEFSDVENLNVVLDEACRLGYLYPVPRERLANQLKSMHNARSLHGGHDRPYWHLVAEQMIKDGELDADVLKSAADAQITANDGSRPKPLGPRMPLPEPSMSTPFLQPWMVWPMWITALGASGGLLWWLIKRPKLPPVVPVTGTEVN